MSYFTEQIKALMKTAEENQSKACAIRDEFKGAVPAEKMDEVQGYIKFAAEACNQITQLKAMESEMEKSSSVMEQMTKVPVNKQQTAAMLETPEKPTGITREMFSRFLAGGIDGLGPTEQHALTTAKDESGGFWVPEDFRVEYLKDLVGYTVIRPLARVINTSKPFVVFPTVQSASTNGNIYTSTYSGAWRGEGYSSYTAQSNPKTGKVRIPVHIWQPDPIEVTQEMLEDPDADFQGMLADVIAETKGLDEDAAFINGDGVGKPLGILNAASGITTVKSGAAANVAYSGLVDLFTSLPAQYRQNAVWIMSSTTYGQLLQLQVGSTGTYVITPNTTPGTLWNRPIMFSEFMPSCQTGSNLPIIFGDMRQYVIVDRKGLTLQRLVEKYAPNVGLLPVARTGGQVVRPAAFRIQIVST